MELYVTGSSSRGNGYALMAESEILLLEAGTTLASTKQTLGFSKKPIVGIVVTHRHGDHAKRLKEYTTAGIPLYAHPDVLSRYGNALSVPLKDSITVSIGGFRVTPFEVFHDVPCFAFLIYHREMGTLLFATDTYALPVRFQNVTHWLLEANYSQAMLDDARKRGDVDAKQYRRIITSHMSLDNCLKYLLNGNAENSHTITLIHLSSRHSNAAQFARRVTEATGTPTFAAFRGFTNNLLP